MNRSARRRTSAWLLGPALLCSALVWPTATRAELWGYVDRNGLAHFATRPLDSRYSPVLRGTADGTGQVPGKVMGRESLLTWLEFAPEVKALQPILRQAEDATGVDAELLKAMIAVESGYRRQLVSPKGAVGLMQIMPMSAERYAGPSTAGRDMGQLLRDPQQNVMIGARMLADLARRFGGVDVALAAWNAGEGTVRRHGNQVPPIAETQAHVHLVLELYWALLQHRQQRKVLALNLVSSPQ